MSDLSENKAEWVIDKVLILHIVVVMYQQYYMCERNCHLVDMPQSILLFNWFKSLTCSLKLTISIVTIHNGKMLFDLLFYLIVKNYKQENRFH